ncbi:MAG: hypothetical protein AAF806_02320 [Bacteroidota bacterium]
MVGNLRSLAVDGDSAMMVNGTGTYMVDLAHQTHGVRLVWSGAGSAVTKHPDHSTFFLGNKYGFFSYREGKTKPIRWKNQIIYPTSFDWHKDTLWLGTLTSGLLAYHEPHRFTSSMSKKAMCFYCA